MRRYVLFLSKLINSKLKQYWIKSNLWLLSWPLSSNSNLDRAELIWISIMTVLASPSDDILHMDHLIFYYRCIVNVLVHNKLHYWLASWQNYKTLQKILNPLILMTKPQVQLLLDFTADPCYHYKNLSDANRNISYITPDSSGLCDNELPVGWYRFVGAAGTKMPTTRVPAYRCDAVYSGWLDDAHPTVEDGKVQRKVCFSHLNTGCKYSISISVKNCGSYFIYKLLPPYCNSRYCGTDWMQSKKINESWIDPKVHVLEGFCEFLFS